MTVTKKVYVLQSDNLFKQDKDWKIKRMTLQYLSIFSVSCLKKFYTPRKLQRPQNTPTRTKIQTTAKEKENKRHTKILQPMY